MKASNISHLAPAAHAADPAAPLQRLAALLTRWIGLDPSSIGIAAIDRACRTRMEAVGSGTVAEYVERIRHDVVERDELIERVVVGESWFFRERQVFAFVTTFARTLAALAGRPPVRILSAPCAAGEEPFSAAMALLDAGLGPGQFSIDALDVSRLALQRAAAGRYSANAFRNADLAFRDRWFRADGGASVIDEAVRRQVRFAHGNLLDAACVDRLAEGGGYDVIFCRNLLIYLTESARGELTRTFDRLLKPDGILVLGAAEPPIIKGGWIPAAANSVFALRRGLANHAALPAGGRPRTGADRTASPPPARTTAPRRPRPAAAAPAAPAPSATPSTAQPPVAHLEAVMEEAGQLANTARFTEALAVCEAHRQQAGPSAALFFLMGMLHQSAGDLDRAEGCFHKTLYLDAAHADALLALALLAAQRGDTVMADKYRQSAARVAARGGAT